MSEWGIIKEKFENLIDRVDKLIAATSSISAKILNEILPELDRKMASIQVSVDELNETCTLTNEKYDRLIKMILDGFKNELNKIKSNFRLDELEKVKEKLNAINNLITDKIDPVKLAEKIKILVNKIDQLTEGGNKNE